MIRDTIVDIFKQYNSESVLSIEEITPKVSKINTNSGKKYIIKDLRLESIKGQYKILSKLNQSGVLVAPILETLDGMCYVKMGEKYYCLFPFIDGECIRSLQHVKGGEHIASGFGTSIAVLHRGLKQISFSKNFSSDLFMKIIFSKGFNFISMHESKSKINTLENIILECKSFQLKFKDLPTQMIHGDLHTENIIWGDNKVSAFIDFERCSTGYRIYDLAYLMANILVEDFQETDNSYWMKLCKSLIKSYDKENPLLQSEYEAIWYCLLFSKFFVTGYLYSIRAFDIGKKHLEVFFWIYKNKNYINEALKNKNY